MTAELAFNYSARAWERTVITASNCRILWLVFGVLFRIMIIGRASVIFDSRTVAAFRTLPHQFFLFER